jgi:hypothetical protein
MGELGKEGEREKRLRLISKPQAMGFLLFKLLVSLSQKSRVWNACREGEAPAEPPFSPIRRFGRSLTLPETSGF